MFALCSRTDIFLFDLFFHTSAIFRVAGSVFYPRTSLISTFFFHPPPSPHLETHARRILASRHLSFFISTTATTKKKKIAKLNFHNKSTLKPVAVFPLQML